MAVIPGSRLTINDTTPQRLDEDETDYNPNTAAGPLKFGRVCSYYVDGSFHLGGTVSVTNSGGNRGALYPAGFYSRPLSGTDQIWLVAPSGQTIHVERDTTGA
jgi:hypothetical protein